MTRRTRTAIIIGALLATVLAGALAFFTPLFIGKAPAGALVKIPKEATAESVHDSLAAHFGPRYAGLTMRAASLSGLKFEGRQGAYYIDEGMSPFRAARKLARGAQTPVRITFNNVRTLPQLAEKVAAKMDFSAGDFSRALLSHPALGQHGLTAEQAVVLCPEDTYEVYWSASPAEVIDKFAANYDRIWNRTRTEKASRLGLTPAQIVTVASIVDEETNRRDEKGKVGRLYINRFERGMPLQADPTVRFAVGDFTIRRVTGKHLAVESPYNTYRNKGLPPGPIRTVGVATIDAVLDSEPGGQIYMCAKEDFSGSHNFASSYAEHQANARRYRAALDRRGIK